MATNDQSTVGKSAVTRPLEVVKGRMWWWISLLVFALGLVVARYIYISNLSFFLQRADTGATVWSLVVVLLSFGVLMLMSVRRSREVGADPRLLLSNLLLFPIPFWVLVLGALPSGTEATPSPFRSLIGQIMHGIRLLAGLGILAALGYGAYAVFYSGPESTYPSPSATKADNAAVRLPSYSECYENGIAYYKEIGSFPRFSTGEDATTEASERCRRSLLAFGR